MSPEFKLAFDAIKAAFPRKPEYLHRFYAGCLRDSGKDAQKWIAETKEKNAKAIAFDKKARALLREKFGSGNYKIHSNGAVSAYGKAPNSIETCWWLYAQDVEDAVRNLTDY